MTEVISKIPARIKNAAVGGHVCGAEDIIDDSKNKTQQQINTEVEESLGSGGSVDERIDQAKSELLGNADNDYNTLGKLEDKIQTEAARAEAAERALDVKVDTLEDAVGTGGSVDSRISAAVATEATRAQTAEADRYTKSETYTKEEVHNLITTPNQEYVTVTATSQTTAATDVLPASGAADTLYRVGNWDGTQYNEADYTEYAWNGSAYVKLSTKTQIGEVYDISANHADTKYADLEAALGTNGANIPQNLRKGGMSVKFVRTSDNKYIQFRLMSDTFSTTVTDWQGVDDEPVAGSDNLVKSGGVHKGINKLDNYILGGGYTLSLRSAITNTGIYLIAGNTYKIKEVSSTIPVRHNFYIEGTSSPFITFVSGEEKEFTPQVSGYAMLYIPDFSSGTYTATLNVGNIIDNKINTSINRESLGISDNNELNKIIKELYLTVDIDLSEVDLISIFKNVSYNGTYITMIRFVNNGTLATYLYDMGGVYNVPTIPDDGLYTHGENYAVVDWSLLETGQTIFRNIHLNVDRCNVLDFSPYIANYLANSQTDAEIAIINNDVDVINGYNISYSLGRNGVGFAQKENIDECDFCYMPVYGQSFTIANDGGYKLTTEFDPNCWMIGNSMSIDDARLFHLSTDSGREFIHTDAINLISKLWKKYAHKTQDFLVGSYGVGDKTILELSKDNGLSDHNWFEEKFLPGLAITKQTLDAQNKTFNCPCILFMQGESDYGLNYVNGCKGNKALYKQRFLALKEDMQDAVMNVTGQTNRPSVMIYVVGGEEFNNMYEGISQAADELAAENSDVVSVGCYYQVPDYLFHPTPDGRRWLAEIIAKVYYEHFMLGIDNTLSVESVKCSGKNVFVKTKNATLPLQIDTKIIPEKENYGFSVFKNIGSKSIFAQGTSGVTIHTGLQLMANHTYTLEVSGTGKANAFIDGDTSVVVYNLEESAGEKTFTPSSSGELVLYAAIDTDFTLTIGNYLENIPISSMQFKGDTIILSADTDIQLPIWVTYGNHSVKGGGNVKDSEPWVSCYLYESNSQGDSQIAITYEPKWIDGTSLIGHHYDMHKWLPNFGVELTE